MNQLDPSTTERSSAGGESGRTAKRGRPRLALLGAILLSTLGGCRLAEWRENGFKVGPEYGQPETAVADAWIDYQDPRVSEDEQQLSQWWKVFNDPILDGLMDEAREQNLSLRVAGARVLEAQAARRFTAGEIFPQQQSAFADYSRSKISESNAFVPPRTFFSAWNVGGGLAWELDFWGRYRRAIEEADAQLDASIEEYDDVLVVLLAEVAAAYIEYRTFEQRLAYAEENVAIQEKSYQLAKDKFEAGATSERDVQQALQVLEETKASIPQSQEGMRHATNALCLLLGIPPADLTARLAADTKIPQAPEKVTIGIPADLLRRRPDVRRAERLVAAASARIGIAESEFYPHLSIVGNLGFQAQNVSSLFKAPQSFVGSVGPTMNWNILHYGRLLSNVEIQDAKFQQAAYAFQDSVLRAGREAEDGLVRYMKEQERAERLAASVAAAQRTLQITDDQYRLGAVDFTPVFVVQATLANQQDKLAVSQGNVALGLVQLYRALGGGWENRVEEADLLSDE